MGFPTPTFDTITLDGSQTAATFLAAPAAAAGAPSMRAIVGTDVPAFIASGATHAPGAVPDPGATAGTTRYLREDATWDVPAGGSGGDLPGPALPSSSYYWIAGVLLGNASFTNTSGGGANAAYVFPFRVPKAISITELGFYNSSISGSSGAWGTRRGAWQHFAPWHCCTGVEGCIPWF